MLDGQGIVMCVRGGKIGVDLMPERQEVRIKTTHTAFTNTTAVSAHTPRVALKSFVLQTVIIDACVRF